MRALLLALVLLQTPAPSRTATGVVTGRILLMDGTAAVGVRVAAVPVSESGELVDAPVLTSITQTDGSGSYRLENVTPGRYYIMAGLVNRPMYYPGVEAPSAASVVLVTANAPVTADFRLPRAVSLKVSGRVLGLPSVSGPRGLQITLLPRTPPLTPFPTGAMKADFSYELTNVAPGTYSVQMLSIGTMTMKEPLIITLAENDLTNVDVVLVDTATKTKQEGLEQVWLLFGMWSAVVGDEKAGVVYASGSQRRSEIDAAGKVQSVIPFPRSSIWRLARFAGVSDVVFLTAGFVPVVEARDTKGNLMWSYPGGAPTPGAAINDVWPVDLDGDQSDEVVVGFNGGTGLHVLDSKGQLLWKTTAIGNVWHVSGGDVRGNAKPQVVTTSAIGKVHVFNDGGTAKTDLDAGVYANMVRVGKLSQNDTAATIFAGGTASESAVLTALMIDGTKKWTLPLQAPGRPSIHSAHLSQGKPWLAVGMQTGVVYVVNAERGEVIATIDGLGLTPEVAWMNRDGADPLLVVGTRTLLTAFRVTGDKERAGIPAQ